MSTVPLLGPDGQVRSIPQDQVSAAIQAGGKQVTQMLDPDGNKRWVPNDQVEAARSAGGSPVLSDEENQSQTRQMLVSGLTGLPTPNMTPQDQEQFYRGKAAGAISVPLVAAGTLGATAATAPTAGQLVRQGAGFTTNWVEQQGPSVIRQALQSPIGQQAVKMIAPHLLKGALSVAGGAAAYKFLKGIGVLQ